MADLLLGYVTTFPRYNPEYGKIVLTVSKNLFIKRMSLTFFKLSIEENLPKVNFSKLI